MKFIDDNFTDLYTLAMLPEGVKLTMRNGRIVQEGAKSGEGVMSFISSTFNAMRRWYNNDNRITAMNEIYTIIQTSFKILETADYDLQRRYLHIFPQVVDGIKNYMKTYSKDTFITARCKILIDNINAYDIKEKCV
jgi:hypothetical protein